ncbi:phosphoglycerate dehydrogenase [Fimbriimonas ginsengisoli]|uniref:D-isomer specific 2-hydroxyacid dehydrogenase n=1 Tax=Fimbriimonas ginsengisoli Gsoil 348 TaxID=661478 RepID=A0A068NWP4_FIMGI|nr:phosphoglycerate dehydrogenase [Fimbriimonas ginsengisoli]AIE86009.1 D-isomer specific 2-hydroxyacid dehydrogenase [Fimbriimonas ginsengisoli Gsoil 348]
MAFKVLVTARAFWSSGEAANDLLVTAGCDVVRSATFGPLTESEVIAQLRGCDAVIASSDAYTEAVFAVHPGLKVVSRWGVGIDSVDLEAATQAGVIATNTPGAMVEAVADYTFGLLLATARRIVEGDRLMRSGGWDEMPGTLVYGKTLGLVGAGRIGQAVARRAAGFGMRVLAFDPPLQAGGGKVEIEFVDLDELLERSDFVCLHAPSLPETKGMFDAKRFAQMKRSAYFINTARGALVDETDLLAALETGRIAGAAIDVYQQEPLPADHPLRNAPRCVLSPHNSSNALESTATMSLMAAENVLAVMQGERPQHLCNPEVWDSPKRRV